jgi:hypothetical protein
MEQKPKYKPAKPQQEKRKVGRPQTNGEGKEDLLTEIQMVMLSPKLLKVLKQKAREAGVKRGPFMRMCFESYISTLKK